MKEMSWSFCPKCGKVIGKGVSVCPNCGYSSKGKGDEGSSPQREKIPKLQNGEGNIMTSIGEKIRTAANVLTFLNILAGAIILIQGINRYVEFQDWYGAEYELFANVAVYGILLGAAMIVGSIVMLFVLQGFAQLVINSDKLIRMAEEPVRK